MRPEIQSTLMIILPLFLQLFGLIFAALSDNYIEREIRELLLVTAVLVGTMIGQNIGDQLMDGHPNVLAHTAIAVYGYGVRPIIIVLFMRIVSGDRKIWPAWLFVGANLLIHMSAFLWGICFTFEPDGLFHRGPLGYTSHIISGFLLIWLLLLTFREFRKERHLDNAIPFINAGFVVGGAIMDSLTQTNLPVSFLTVAVVSACVFYYIWIHLQFVRQHEASLLAEQRIQIMISQIQPHFLYNTLSTIQALCRIDPEKAFETTEKFGTYLRQNIDSLAQADLIPVEKELEHTRIYTDIEMLRFPSILIDYQIEDTDFMLPALTIQPMVENAIRYGVRVRQHGIVTVRITKEEDCHQIVISDNGKGFDPLNIEQNPSLGTRSHIGLKNVRERVEKMCGGTMTIDSVIDQGTTITIRLPFEEDKEEEKDSKNIFRKIFRKKAISA